VTLIKFRFQISLLNLLTTLDIGTFGRSGHSAATSSPLTLGPLLLQWQSRSTTLLPQQKNAENRNCK